MKRVVGQLVFGLVVVTAWGAHTVQAQTLGVVEAPQWSAQFDLAATFGHVSGSSIGGELDRRLNQTWEAFAELGHMSNVASRALQDRASLIAAAIGGTATPTQGALYYDLGLRYHLLPEGKWNPYVAVGLGVARLKTTTSLVVNGAQLTDAQLADAGVALGVDLDGSISKPLVLIGAGVQLPFKERFVLDGSYRFGRIFPRSSEIAGDSGVNTQRVQIGFGVRF